MLWLPPRLQAKLCSWLRRHYNESRHCQRDVRGPPGEGDAQLALQGHRGLHPGDQANHPGPHEERRLRLLQLLRGAHQLPSQCPLFRSGRSQGPTRSFCDQKAIVERMDCQERCAVAYLSSFRGINLIPGGWMCYVCMSVIWPLIGRRCLDFGRCLGHRGLFSCS